MGKNYDKNLFKRTGSILDIHGAISSKIECVFINLIATRVSFICKFWQTN
jgi:hypothetical protein